MVGYTFLCLSNYQRANNVIVFKYADSGFYFFSGRLFTPWTIQCCLLIILGVVRRYGVKNSAIKSTMVFAAYDISGMKLLTLLTKDPELLPSQNPEWLNCLVESDAAKITNA